MAKKKGKTKFIQYLTASDGSFGSMRQGDIIECDNRMAEYLVEKGVAKFISEEDANNALNDSVKQKTYAQIPKAKLYARGAQIVTQSAASQPAEEEEAPVVVKPQVRSDDDEYKDSYGEQ